MLNQKIRKLKLGDVIGLSYGHTNEEKQRKEPIPAPSHHISSLSETAQNIKNW